MGIAPDLDIDARTLAAFLRGMEAVAKADGAEHAGEIALLDGLRAELAASGEVVDETVTPIFTDGGTREAYVRSLAAVALADGRMGEAERAVVLDLAAAQGVSPDEVAEVVRGVAREFLATFQGVTAFREQVLQIAADLGFTAEEAEQILG